MPTREFLDALVPRPAGCAQYARRPHAAGSIAVHWSLPGSRRRPPTRSAESSTGTRAGAPSGTLQETAMRLVERLAPRAVPCGLGAGHPGRPADAPCSRDHRLSGGVARRVALRAVPLGRRAGRADDADGGQPPLARRRAATSVIEELLERRAHGTVGRLRIRGVKLFQDGVVESHTAAMLDPTAMPTGR